MMIFTSVMVGLGMNLIIIGSIFLLFKVIQRMNKFEQVFFRLKKASSYFGGLMSIFRFDVVSTQSVHVLNIFTKYSPC